MRRLLGPFRGWDCVWNTLAVFAIAAVWSPQSALAQTQRTWSVTSGTWSTAGSWLDSLAPGATDTAYFSDASVGSGSVTSLLSTNVTIAGLSFNTSGSTVLRAASGTAAALNLGTSGIALNATAGPVTIGASGSAVNLFLTGTQAWTNDSASLLSILGTIDGGSALTIAGSGSTTLSGALIRLPSLRKEGSGTLTLSAANTFSGTTRIVAGGLTVGNAGALQWSTLDMAAGDAGTITFNQASTLGGLAGTRDQNLGGVVLTVGQNGQSTTYGGVLSGTSSGGGLTKIGQGTLTLTGSSTYTGTTGITSGVLQLGSGSTTGAVSSSSVLALGSGRLVVNRSDTFTQAFASTLLSGGGAVTANANNTVNFGAITRSAGGTLDIPTTGTFITSSTNVNGILPAITYGGTTWAVSGTTTAITGLAAGSYTTTTTAGSTAASYANVNIDVDSSPTLSGAIAANSLRFAGAAAQSLTLTGSNTVSRGILVTAGVGANLSTITGGTLAGSSGGDLVVIQNNPFAGLTISSTIVNNTSATALTKSGPGLLTLTASNSYTGGTRLNEGTLSFANNSLSPTTGNVTLAGGTLQWATGNTQDISSRIAVVPGAVATLDTNGNNVTGTATIGSSAAAALVKVGAGTLTVTTNNTAGLTVNAGRVNLAGWANNPNNTITVNSGGVLDFTGGGPNVGATNSVPVTPLVVNAGGSLVSTGQAGTPLGPFTLAGGTYSASGTDVNRYPNALNGTVSVIGDLTSTIINSTIVNQLSFTGIPLGSLNVSNALDSTFTVTFDVADGAAATDLSVTGSIGFGDGVLVNNTNLPTTRTSNLVKAGAGTMVLSTTNTYTGLTRIDAGTFQLGNGGGAGALAAASTITGSAGGTLAFNRINTITQGTIAGGINVVQRGNGTTVLTANNTYTGTTSVLAGTLQISSSTAVGSVSGSSVLALGSGRLAVNRSDAFTQAFAGTVLTGNGVVSANANNTLNFGPISRSGGSLNIPTTGTFITSSPNVNGMLAGVTYGGTTWAVSGTTTAITGLAAGSYTTTTSAGNTPANYASANIDVTSSQSPSAAIAANSLRFAGAAPRTLSLTGANSVAGGILVTAAVGGNASTITGGTLAGSSGGDLLVIQNANAAALPLSITSVIADNGSATGLSKSGEGRLVVTSGATYTGTTSVNFGSLQVGDGGTAGSIASSAAVVGGAGGTLVFNRGDNYGGSYGMPISGQLGLSQIGSGTLTLTGNNTYTGPTTINAGVLVVGTGGTAGSIANSSGISGAAGTTLVFNGSGNYGGWYAMPISGRLNLTQLGTGTLTLSAANTFSGTTRVAAGGLTVNNANALQWSTLEMAGGTPTFSQASTLGGLSGTSNLSLGGFVLTVGNNSQSTTYGGVLSGTSSGGGLTKIGSGTLTLTAASTYTGTTGITTGVLQLGSGGAAGAVNPSSVLAFGSGRLVVNRSDTFTQAFASTLLSGGGAVSANATNTVNFGAITRSSGGTLDIPTTGTFITSSANVNGILPAITYGGTTWAVSGTTTAITGLAAGSYTTTTTNGDTAGNYAATQNIDVDSSPTLSGAIAANSLRFAGAAAQTLTLTGSNTVSRGILVTAGVGANLSTITGGTLAGSSGGDLVVIQNNPAAGLAISSTIVNNTSATALTKSGPGLLTLTASNSYTGGTRLNEGTLSFANGGLSGTSGGNVTLAGGTLQWATGNTQDISSRIAVVPGAVATLDTNGNSVTLGTAIGSSAAAALVKVGAGTLTVTTNNTAGLTVNAGRVNLAGWANNPNNTITVNSGGVLDFTGGGPNVGATNPVPVTPLVVNAGGSLVSTGQAGTPLGPFTLAGGTYSASGTNVNRYPNALNGTVSVIGDLTSTIINSTFVNQLTFMGIPLGSLNVSNALDSTFTVTFDVADGAAATDLIVTGSIGLGDGVLVNNTNLATTRTSNLVKAGAGTMVLSTTNTYTGLTRIDAGTFQLGNGGGAGALTAASTITGSAGGTLAFNRSDTITQGSNTFGTIAGGINVVQRGNGTTVLAANNTYTGTTSVELGTLQIGNGGTAGSIVGSAAITGSTGETLRFNGTGDYGGNYAMPIGGGLNLVQAGSGTLSLTGINTYAGTTSVTAGILSIPSTASLPGWNVANQLSVSAGGALVVADGVTDADFDTIRSSGAFAANSFIGFNTTGNGTYSGTGIAGSLGLMKIGSGTETLNVANTFTGTTAIRDGMLRLGVGNAIASSALVALSGNGRLGFGSTVTSATLTAISATTAIALQNDASQGVALSLGNGNVSASYSIAFTGPGSLVKIGTGQLSLTGSNSYAGTTTITGGTLALGNVNALAGGGGIATSGNNNSTLRTDVAGGSYPTIATQGIGILTVSGSSSSFNGLSLQAGRLDVTPAASSTIALGAITRSAGSGLSLQRGTGVITVDPATSGSGAGSIIGPWAVTGSTTSLTYATHTSGTIGGYSASGTAATAAGLPNNSTANFLLQTATGAIPATVSANTIRYTGGTLTTTVGSSFTVNGLMNAGSGDWTINSGTISVGSANELVVATNAQAVTIGSVILENAAGQGLTFVSQGGSLTLNTSAGNRFSGPINVTGGNLALNSSGTYGVVNLEGGRNLSANFSGSQSLGAIAGVGSTFTKAGTGTTSLLSTSSYTGASSIQQGILEVASLPAIGTAGGLGNPTAANGTIQIGNSTTAATLRYVGNTASTTDRVVNLAGTTGGATLDASGSGPLVFTSTFTASNTASTKTLTLTGTSTAANQVGVITGANVNVSKTGSGLWRLAGNSSYDGRLTVLDGTVVVATNVDIVDRDSPFGKQSSGSINNFPLIGDSSGTASGTAALLAEGVSVARGLFVAASSGSQTVVIGGVGSGTATFQNSSAMRLGRGVTLQASTGGRVEFWGEWQDLAGGANPAVAFTVGSSGNAGTVALNSDLPNSATALNVANGTAQLMGLGDRINSATPVTVGSGLGAAALDLNGFSQTLSNLTFAGNSGSVTGGTLRLATSPAVSVTGTGHTISSLVELVATASFNVNPASRLSIASEISGVGFGLTKAGAGILELSGTSSYSGATSIDAGSLLVNGRLGNTAVTVQAAATLGGSGRLAGSLTGDGLIAPGNSPGILTVDGQITPTGTTSFAFEFSGTGSPTWSNASASINDVLRLTNANPFTSGLGAGNVVSVYFDVASLVAGDAFLGGFFSDRTSGQLDFMAELGSPTYQFFVLGNGSGTATSYNGKSYYTLAQYNPALTGATVSVTTVASADFAGGTAVANGQVTQFVIIPEPGAMVLAAIGIAAAAYGARRFRGPRSSHAEM